MEKKVYYLLIILFAITGCKKMDETFKEYVVPGGLKYAGKATSPVAKPGKKRVEISWLRGADPFVTKAKIFWDNYAHSVEVTIPPTGDTISAIIDNLEERRYSFMIRTYNSKGDSSVSTELLTAVYGDNYQSSLIKRFISEANWSSVDTLSIKWAAPADISNGASAMEVKYTNTSGIVKIRQFPANEPVTKISDMKRGTSFEYRSVYLPDSLAIDAFYTDYVAGPSRYEINKGTWIIKDFNSEHDNIDNAVVHMIDRTEGTRWHTHAGGSSYPHHVTIDMGAIKKISQFGVWRTTFQNPGGDNRGPDRIKFLVSNDNIAWTDLGEFNFNRHLSGEQIFTIPSKPEARYFRFVGISGPHNYMVLGEISAYEP